MVKYKDLEIQFRNYFNIAAYSMNGEFFVSIFEKYKNGEALDKREYEILFNSVKGIFEELLEKYKLEMESPGYNSSDCFCNKRIVIMLEGFIDYINVLEA